MSAQVRLLRSCFTRTSMVSSFRIHPSESRFRHVRHTNRGRVLHCYDHEVWPSTQLSNGSWAPNPPDYSFLPPTRLKRLIQGWKEDDRMNAIVLCPLHFLHEAIHGMTAHPHRLMSMRSFIVDKQG